MAEPDLTIGLVAHHVFCPRRAWLEVHGERTDTEQMAIGVDDHAAVDDPATSRFSRSRAVDVASYDLGVRGRCDSVEVADDGSLTVLEHKATPSRRRTQVTDAQAVQLALQAIALREAGHVVTGAGVWFSTTQTRVDVPLTEELLAAARDATSQTRATLSAGAPPEPLEDDSRCQRCSHVSVCLPDEHRRRNPARRIGVGDPLGRVLHLTTPGSRASLRRGRIEIRAPDHEVIIVPVGQVAGLVVHGNADVSSALLRETLARGFPIVWCSWSGRVIGWATPADSPNGDARGPQHRLEPSVALAAARGMVYGKIHNQRQMLRRHQLDGRDTLQALARDTASALSQEHLFGLEGRAAATYFRMLGSAIKPGWASIHERRARPARDPINAALNLAYALLLADVIRAVVACGLDPRGAFFIARAATNPLWPLI